jgi:nitrous oxidase accessory protein NosD
MNIRRTMVLTLLAFSLATGLMLLSKNMTTQAAGPVCTVPGDYATIQAAVNDPGCLTINVAPGAYAENVTINRALTLNGAQAGNDFSGRTFAGAGESTLTGQITIQAAGVTIDGFSITNPGQASSAIGILVKTAGSGAVIQNNIIDSVSSTLTTSQGTAQGVYLENGPDNVSILDNLIRNIQSDRSAKGVFIGDSLAADPSLNILIEGNTIEDITSVTRGAYGVQVNNGASTLPAATGYTEVTVKDNIIDDLNGGGWAHAVGLEGDTPVAVVTGNCISDVIDLTPSVPEDAIAVWFEANPSFGSAEVHQNNFTNVSYGIAVHPALTALLPAALVDGENNWWGSASGPGPVGPGTGAKVSPGVDYTPWLIAPALGGACGGQEATTKDQCKNGGWQTFFRANGTSFKNQGDCIQYVNNGK